jgi:hypothetical protein
MKQRLPLLFASFLPVVAAAQLGIGAVVPVAPPPVDHARGIDTLFSFGVVNAINAGQIASYLTPEGGMLLGTSEYGVTEFAQQFDTYGDPVSVDGAVFFFSQKVFNSGSAESRINVRLRRMNGLIGTTSTTQFLAPSPNTTLAQADLPMAQVTTTGFSGVSFAPVYLQESFAISYSISNLAAGDSINCAATTDGFVEQQDYSWLRLPPLNIWTTLLAAIGTGGNIDLVVGAVYTPGAVNVGSSSRVNGMQLSLLGGNPNPGSLTIATDSDRAARQVLRVLDAQGRTVLHEDWGTRSGTQQRSYDISGWEAGLYYVNIFSDGRPITKRLVVE